MFSCQWFNNLFAKSLPVSFPDDVVGPQHTTGPASVIVTICPSHVICTPRYVNVYIYIFFHFKFRESIF